MCPACDGWVTPTLPEQQDVPKKHTRKKSNDQERRAASRHGAKVVAGSGSSELSKGDIRKRGELRGECKYTAASSYTLRVADLVKLELETRGEEVPVFEIEFQCDLPHRRYYVIPDHVYHRMVQASAPAATKLQLKPKYLYNKAGMTEDEVE